MSLRDKFKSDPELSGNGKWFYYKDAPNKDGSIPGVKLARISAANPRYMKLVSEAAEGNGGKVPDNKEDEIFVDGVLLDWCNFQPDDDGRVLEFSREAALTLMADKSWLDLRNDWRGKAVDIANFRAKELEATAKN